MNSSCAAFGEAHVGHGGHAAVLFLVVSITTEQRRNRSYEREFVEMKHPKATTEKSEAWLSSKAVLD